MSQVPVADSKPCVPKPVLKGLHNASIKRNLAIAIGLTVVLTAAFKILVNDPKKRRYAEFYKNYDAQKSFERMRDAGLLQSCSKE